MQQLKISFFRLQTLKKALLFLKNFRKGGGTPRPLQNNILPPLAKVLVAPLVRPIHYTGWVLTIHFPLGVVELKEMFIDKIPISKMSMSSL